MTPLTGQLMLDMLRSIVDDSSISDDLGLSFINTAKDQLELERDWCWLIQHDSSISWASGDIYTTQHTLPTNFSRHISVYVDGFDFPFDEAPWEHRYQYRNTSYRFSVDYYNRKLHFMGTNNTTRSVYLAYIADDGDLDVGDTPNGWPAKLHKMFVFKAAELWLAGTDADNVTKLMAPEHAREYALLRQRAVMLDAKLRLKARNFRSVMPPRDIARQADVVDLNG